VHIHVQVYVYDMMNIQCTMCVGIWYICTLYYTSNIAVMDENSKATFQDGVQYRIKSVPSLDYHVKDPAQPK